MATEVHRIVEESDDLHGAGAEPIKQNVPRGPATLGDMKGANARANIVARLATTWIARDRLDGFLDEVAIFARLDDPPAVLRVRENLDISRLACAERITRIVRELGSQPDRGVDLGHEFVDGALGAPSSVELGDAHV